MNDQKDHGGTRLTEGASVSVSASEAASHAAQTHTPGPWMSFDSGTMVITCNDAHDLIANLEDCEIETIAEREANAHLIAAAPELLEACRAALDEMCKTVAPRNSFTDAVDRLDAAIEKAEGR